MPLLLRVDQELDEGVELGLGQAREGGMTSLGKPGCDVGVRVDDRLSDEVLERLARLLRVRRELIEVRARPSRSRSAGLKVWQLPQPLLLKTACPAPGPELPVLRLGSHCL